MGSQHSKDQLSSDATNSTAPEPQGRNRLQSEVIVPNRQQYPIAANEEEESQSAPKPETPESTKPRPLPSKLKRFRVKVPESMVPGDIMTIKLGGNLTKILIATPTTTTPSTRTETKTPSRSATSCSSSSVNNSNAASIIDSVIASTDANVPEGKMIVEAKPVIVVHATFEQTDKALKEHMIDEVMREIIQETVGADCNAILGMTISIKKQDGYFVKACGTPCLLLPAQVHLPTTRKSTSSTDLLPVRRQ